MWHFALIIILLLPVITFPAIYLGIKSGSRIPSLPLAGAVAGALIAIVVFAISAASMPLQCSVPNSVLFLDCILWLVDGFIAAAAGAMLGTIVGGLIHAGRNRGKGPVESELNG